MISLRNAGVRFGDRWVFRDLGLDVRAGTSLAILGPNGRGKTTLIRALVGVQALSEGAREAPPLIGYVPQTGPAAPYGVLEMVVMGRAQAIGAFRSPARADYEAARAALAMVGLSGLAARSYRTISGGERQLVMLARALATGADTIVLDEPASALDLANQRRLLGIVNDLRAQGRHTIVFSTHLPQHALIAADATLLMMPANASLSGPTSEVLSEDNLERVYRVPIRRIAIAGEDDAIVPVLGHTTVSRRSPLHV